MRRHIWIILASAGVLALGLFLWKLDIPHWQPLDLQKIRSIPESTAVFDAHGQPAGTLCALRERSHISLKRLPEHVPAAFIAAEDQRFYSHGGLDIRRIFAALWHDIKTGSLQQGASTITQQLIKLTHLSGEKTLSRKAQEAWLALQLEKRIGKDEILESYLNTVYFGSGAYGVDTAARLYFGKGADKLSTAEAALLAGVIKSPTNYSPRSNPENALKRRKLVLDSMLETGAIDAKEHARAVAEPLNLIPEETPSSLGGWYMDQVLTEAEEILDLPADEILLSGLHIYTGFRPEYQAAADALFENGANFPDAAADGTPAEAALVVMDVKSGEMCALVGGREYSTQRGLNRATQMMRSPGSAIKPISTYAAAIERAGFLPTSMVEDVQREFPGGYMPGNAGGSYYGTVTLREALSRSLNVATVDLADRIGMVTVRNAAAAFGLPLDVRDVNLSLALGSMTRGISPAQLCAAYAALANGGVRYEAHCIRRITDSGGKLIYEAPQKGTAAVKPQTAFLLTDMLKTAAQDGSAKALAEAGMPVMGKTGTVGEKSGGNRDIWTAAATPEVAVCAWMGFDEPSETRMLPDWAGGSSYPARLCASFLRGIGKNLSGHDFAPAEGLVSVEIDAAALQEEKQVLLAAENTPAAYRQVEWFPPDRRPDSISTLWNAPQAIDDLTLLSASGDPPMLAFTARDSTADYLLMRRQGDEREIAAVLAADAGQVILWTDTNAEAGESYEYSVLPRHRLLYECGTLLTGSESNAVRYNDGLLSRILG